MKSAVLLVGDGGDGGDGGGEGGEVGSPLIGVLILYTSVTEAVIQRWGGKIWIEAQGLPVVLLKMLHTGVLFEGIGNLYSIHLHSFLWLKAKQDSLHACIRMKHNLIGF